MNNKPKSDYYKNILLNDYPDTEYARIIKNPESAKEMAANKNLIEKFYSETYELYAQEKYTEALENCKKAEVQYSKSPLMPKFAFIKAMCIGRTQDITSFENSLVQLLIKYPKDPVKERAQEMLDLIKKQRTPAVDSTQVSADTVKKAKFVFKETGEYYWIAVIENGKADINKFKARLSDYNKQSYSLYNLSVSNVLLSPAYQLVSVKTFDGRAKAMDYYKSTVSNNDLFSSLPPGSYRLFVISAENYTPFYKDKNIEEYQQFFTQNFK